MFDKLEVNGIKVKKVLHFGATPGFGKWKKYFPKESVAHPAKANLKLLEYLILSYTKEGDVILDPMMGTGSTIVMSMLNNRNGIGVDLEEKFVTWAKEAIRNVENKRTITPKGKGIAICGDARNLSELLKEHEEEISYVLFSPPYKTANKGGGLNKNPPGTFRGVLKNHSFKMSDNPNNIDNLPFNADPGSACDCIVTSPPFAGTSGGKDEKSRTPINENYPGLFERCIGGNKGALSDNPAQIDNLPFNADCIVTSPPFAETISKKAGGASHCKRIGISSKTARSYSEYDGNIGNLSFDAAIFSPPYSLGHDSGDNASEDYKERLEEQRKHTRAYSIGNIAKLPFISAILFSPPFFNSLYHLRNKPIGFWEKLAENTGRKAWLNPDGLTRKTQAEKDKGYGEDVNNIGNLKDFGVDAVLTSLPISKNAGGVDACLFSPAYYGSSGIDTEEAMKRRLDKIFVGRSYVPTQRYNLDRNIGNLKDFGVDAVLTSPPYEGSLSDNKESPLAGGDEEKYGRWKKGTAKKNSYTQHGEPVDETVSRLREHGRTDEKAGGEFGKSLGHPYSHKEENIGNLKSSKEEYEAYQNKKDKKKGKSETYLEAMKTVYEQCFLILKPHGLLILILKNFIRDKKVIPLTEYTIKLCESVGFKLKERLLFKLPQKSFWRVLYEKQFPEVDTSDLQYEHIIIFERDAIWRNKV